jgi:hypothetical protein
MNILYRILKIYNYFWRILLSVGAGVVEDVGLGRLRRPRARVPVGAGVVEDVGLGRLRRPRARVPVGAGVVEDVGLGRLRRPRPSTD